MINTSDLCLIQYNDNVLHEYIAQNSFHNWQYYRRLTEAHFVTNSLAVTCMEHIVVMLHRYLLIVTSPKYSTVLHFRFHHYESGETVTSYDLLFDFSSFRLTGRDKQPLPAASVLTCHNIGDDDTKNYVGFCY